MQLVAVNKMNKNYKEINYDNMSDEEIDELYRPQKSNSRRSLAPLFIYAIIVGNSSEEKHLSQQDIIDLLATDYEIYMERKAVGRILHTLVGDGLIKSYPKYGAWYDESCNQLLK